VFESIDDAAALERGGVLTLNCADLSVADLVSQALMAAGDRVASGVSLDVGDIRVWGDLDRLVSILTNVLINCAKHAPGSRVEIAATGGDEFVRVSVRDHGPGVPADSVGTIFKKFGRGTTPATGSGLGLFVARGIARAHGGHLRYRAASGGGAEFTLEIPVGAGPEIGGREELQCGEPGGHGVHFYRAFDDVVPTIAAELAGAADRGHAVVVVATADHRRSIETALAGLGIVGSARYVALDAEALLAAITAGDDVDPERFDAHVGMRFEELASTFGGVAAYGELADLLWRSARPASARQLEELFDDLSQAMAFSPVCGYEASSFASVADIGTLAALHAHVHAR
jgi:hypothetical protein